MCIGWESNDRRNEGRGRRGEENIQFKSIFSTTAEDLGLIIADSACFYCRGEV
jgi:hypothetical protein